MTHEYGKANIDGEDSKGYFKDDDLVSLMSISGKWQVIICSVAASSKIIGIWNMFAILFLTPTTEYKCIKFKGNGTIDAKISTCYEDCEKYEYYHDIFEETLTSEFGLICEREWLASFPQTFLMFGLMIGVFMFGWISDRFGRRFTIILSGSIDVVFMLSSSYASNYWTFIALRFLVGFGIGGIMTTATVFVLETVSTQYRELAGGLAQLSDGIAYITLAAFAYFAPTWNIYLLGISVTSAVILVTVIFIPETPRWLISNGKANRIVRVMKKHSKFTNSNIEDIRENVTAFIQERDMKHKKRQYRNYIDLFRTKQLSIITVSSFMIWFIAGICYFGLSQYNTVIGSNIYIIVIISGVFYMPLVMLTSVITKIFGRKMSTIGTYIMSGLSMICLIFTTANTWTSTVLAFIGVSSAYLNFCVLFIYVTELYPTSVRNMGCSVSSAGSKLGATIAPFIARLKPQWAASLIFAVLPMIAAAICLLLPETKGQKLRDTIEEDENS